MGFKSLLKTASIFLKNNSSNILTGLSIAGVGFTVWTAHQDTIKAEDILYRKNPETNKEAFQLTWKCYIPTAISATSTVACIIGSNYCSAKQVSALSSAYLLSQTTLQEYQRKVVEKIGANKEKDLRNEVIKEIAHKQNDICPCSPQEAYETGHGNTLFYDEVIPGGLYFKSDINYLKTVVNDLNREVMSEMEFDWNELMYRWGLPSMKYGSDRVITPEYPLDVRYVPEMMENGQVRIVVSYDLQPRRSVY